MRALGVAADAESGLFLEATGEVFRGDTGECSQPAERSDVSYVGHLRGYHDITEATNLDLGASFAYGHNAAGSSTLDAGRALFGIDATFR